MWTQSERRHARSNWLWWLLFERRADDRVQPHLEKAVRRWLSLWSREPDRPRHWTNEQERITEHNRIGELRKSIESHLSALSEAERAFLATTASEVANPELMKLDALALHVIAGLPLDPFVERVVAWHLLTNVASRFFDAHESMAWVLRLNPNAEAIGAKLHKILDQLAIGQPSQTGLWARYGILRSTGLPHHAEEAEQITKQLDNYRYYPGLRRVEHFCDSDPLDPASPQPTNIEKAVEHVSAFDVSNLRKFMSRGMEDNDLEDLTPALARFRPEVIIGKLRAYAADLIDRSGHAARLLAFDLPDLSVLLTDIEVATLRDAFNKFVSDPTTSTDSDQRVAAQYILLGLLPHLEAEDQFDALMKLPDERGEMITLRPHFKTLGPDALADRLISAEKLDSTAQSATSLRRTLFFASAGKDVLTDPARAVIARAFNHSDPVIRLLAFDAASMREDASLLKKFADSDWNALRAGTTHTEAFYGSKALAYAPAELHTVDNLLRMTLEWQTRVIATWEDACVRQHAALVIEQVRNTLGLPAGIRPEVRAERNVATPEQPSNYPYLATHDDEPKKPTDIMEAMRRLSSPSDDSEWKAEQKRQQEAISKYLRTLREHDAQRLVDYAYMRGFAIVADRAPDLFSVLTNLFQSAPKDHLSNLCNAIAFAAVVLSPKDAKAGAELIKKIVDVEPDICLTIGGARLPWHRLALWHLQDSDAVGHLRRQRIVRAPDDSSLFTEVLCGQYAGKQTELLACATSLITSGCPADIARGIMIAGFCDANEETPRLLDDARFRHGFLGSVAKLARESYERNLWARHWYNEATKASDRATWWRAIELMIDATDGRFVLWFDLDRFETTPSFSFAEFARARLVKRADQKLKKRADKLFGMSPPRTEILEGYDLTS